MVQGRASKTSEQWVSVGQTGMQKGEYMVGKYLVQGTWIYTLWKGQSALGRFKSFDEVKLWLSENQ